MGYYLNPENILFQECLNSEIYVDKTSLIKYTNAVLHTKNKLLCVSRPRRFGKSMALEMLAAYYSKGCDSRKLFQNLKIGRENTAIFEKGLNRYDVLWIDLQGVLGCVMEETCTQQELTEFYQKLPHMSAVEIQDVEHPKLIAIQREVIKDIRKNEEYADYIAEDEKSLGNALQAIYEHTKSPFILLIDEWDCIFRNYEQDKLLQDKYIGWLRDMFKNTKRLSLYALVYMTGILPIKRYGTQSALNNFREYTFLNPLKMAEFSGFTEEEVKELCEKYNIDFIEMSSWYNGYYFQKVGKIYNPRSVVCAIENEEFGNFWTATGTYESVKNPINMNFDGLKEKVITMLGNGRCKINVSKFQNDMVTFNSADDVFTLLVHLGYLGYDVQEKEVYIPNKEIRDEFVNAIEGDNWSFTLEAISQSEELLQATLNGDEDKVAACIEKVHSDNTALLTYNNENALSCVIQIAYYQAQNEYMLIREMPAGKGFCDIVFLPKPSSCKPAIVIELKWKKSAETAINQIKNRQYSDKLCDYFGDVLLVGISYNKDSSDKKHTCKIEKVYK